MGGFGVGREDGAGAVGALGSGLVWRMKKAGTRGAYRLELIVAAAVRNCGLAAWLKAVGWIGFD